MRTQLSYDSEGLTDDKQATLQTLIKQTVALAKVGYVWAKSQQDLILMEVLDLETTDFNRATLSEAIALAEKLEENLRVHLEDLEDFNITEGKLNSLKDNIQYLRAVSPKPKHQIVQNKTLYQHFSEDLKKNMGIAREIEDLVIGEFAETESRFVDRLVASMRIFDPATRSTALQLAIVDEQGKPIAQAECDVLEVSGEEQLTNVLGQAELKGLRSGTYTIEVRKNGYKPQQNSFNIKRGDKVALNITLQKES